MTKTVTTEIRVPVRGRLWACTSDLRRTVAMTPSRHSHVSLSAIQSGAGLLGTHCATQFDSRLCNHHLSTSHFSLPMLAPLQGRHHTCFSRAPLVLRRDGRGDGFFQISSSKEVFV